MPNQDYEAIYSPRTPIPEPVRRFALTVLPQIPNNVPLLYAVLGTGTPPWKMSGTDSQYMDVSQVPGQQCGNCRFSYQHIGTQRYICDQIRPAIRLEGWCRLWQPVQR